MVLKYVINAIFNVKLAIYQNLCAFLVKKELIEFLFQILNYNVLVLFIILKIIIQGFVLNVMRLVIIVMDL